MVSISNLDSYFQWVRWYRERRIRHPLTPAGMDVLQAYLFGRVLLAEGTAQERMIRVDTLVNAVGQHPGHL